jgi:hypothetical protein
MAMMRSGEDTTAVGLTLGARNRRGSQRIGPEAFCSKAHAAHSTL